MTMNTGPNKYLDKIQCFRINNAPLEMIHHIVLGEENTIYVNKSNIKQNTCKCVAILYYTSDKENQIT